MTEHPNYKYRPRRRKHNKQRATSGPVPRVGNSLPSPSLPNMSPRYSGYIPNSSLSPSIPQQSNYGSMDFPSPGSTADYSQGEKRYSPVTFQQKFGQYSYMGYQQSYSQKSPYDVQTPDTSPTHSPEPKGGVNHPKSPQDAKDNAQEERSSALPTPELSPLEQDKDQYQYSEEKQRISNIQHTGNISNSNANSSNLSPTQYTTRVQNYRQPNTAIYTNAQPITSVPMANGMYVMCANKSSVEQGHVVTGTFYPPVATSQDQQLLGSSQNNLNTIANSASNIQYYNSHMAQYYHSKEYQSYEHAEVEAKSDAFMNYGGLKNDIMIDKSDYDLNYKNHMNDSFAGYGGNPVPMVQPFIHQNEERSDVDSDVDAREFDKYLKFTNSEANAVIDSNHNYHRSGDSSVNSNLTYNFQAQHTSVILPNTNIKSEPMLGQYPEVYHDLAQNGVQKNDDDFSEILADVRKTCYSNWNC